MRKLALLNLRKSVAYAHKRRIAFGRKILLIEPVGIFERRSQRAHIRSVACCVPLLVVTAVAVMLCTALLVRTCFNYLVIERVRIGRILRIIFVVCKGKPRCIRPIVEQVMCILIGCFFREALTVRRHISCIGIIRFKHGAVVVNELIFNFRYGYHNNFFVARINRNTVAAVIRLDVKHERINISRFVVAGKIIYAQCVSRNRNTLVA